MAPVATQFTQRVHDVPHHHRLDVHEGYLARAARQRLEPECTAPRVEIEATAARYHTLQPVEGSLAHPVGRRPDGGQRRETHLAAAPLAANDAQQQSAAVRRGPRR